MTTINIVEKNTHIMASAGLLTASSSSVPAVDQCLHGAKKAKEALENKNIPSE